MKYVYSVLMITLWAFFIAPATANALQLEMPSVERWVFLIVSSVLAGVIISKISSSLARP